MSRKRFSHLFAGMSLCVIAFGLAAIATSGDEPASRVGSGTPTVPVGQGEAVGVIAAIPEGARHTVFLQLDRILDAGERAALEASGICLMEYVGDRTWFASVEGGVRMPSAPGQMVIATWAVRPEDRLHPSLVQGTVRAHAIAPDGQFLLNVLAFGNVDLSVLAQEIQQLGGTVDSISEPFDTIFVRVPPGILYQVADLDDIHWIEPVAPPPTREMYRARAFLNQTSLPSPPYSLTGAGVEASVHDCGHAYQHPDYSSRWVHGDASAGQALGPHYHATNTAGTIAGDGTLNSLYQGMASGATVVTYSYDGTSDCTDPAWEANNYADIALALGRGVEVSNNSWGHAGCNPATSPYGLPYGDYTTQARVFDRQVLGMDNNGNAIGSPTVVVFSAGNERDGYWDGSTNQLDCITDTSPPYANYDTINQPKPAKNIIVVGAVDSHNDRMTVYSSWGPTSDGRLRPDIVAAGHHDGTLTAGVTEWTTYAQGYLTTYYPPPPSPGSNYGYFGMTSAAAAMVSGNAALFIEDFRSETAGSDPLPSTVKAHFIHTARDLDDSTTWYNPGPDYASGYGVLNIQAAVDQLRDGGWVEDCVDQGNTNTMTMYVPPATTSVKVTLVWDDVPASPATTAPALVNDLDLVVTDANGARRYPWTLNPASPSANAVRTAEDHLNNVEVVLADGSVPDGNWTVQVVGTTVPSGPQCYSLVYSPVSTAPSPGALHLFFGPDNAGVAAYYLSGPTDPYQVAPNETAYLWATTEAGDIWHALGLDFTVAPNAGQLYLPEWSAGAFKRWNPGSDTDPTDGGVAGIAVTELGLGDTTVDDFGVWAGGTFLYKVAEVTYSSAVGDVFMAVGPALIVKRGSSVGEPVYFGFGESAPIYGDNLGAMSSIADLRVVMPGDLNGDGCVDLTDLNLLLANRGNPASGPSDPMDLDGDGWITVLDARILVTLCTNPYCAAC